MKTILITITAILLAIPITIFAQDGKYGATPEDSINCVSHISMYREFYKQKNYADAIPHWRYVFLNCPKSTKYMYVDGLTLVKLLFDMEKDEVKKEAYIDTLMMVYDQRIENYGEKAYVLGRKGSDMLKYRGDKPDAAYKVLKESVDDRGVKSESNVISYYMQATALGAINGNLDSSNVFDVFDQCMPIAEQNIKEEKDPKEKERWENTRANIEALFEPFATCASLVPMYEKKFAESPDDVEGMKKMLNMLDRKGCAKEPVYLKIAEALYAKEPSSDAAYSIAKLYLAKEEFRSASKFYEEAIEKQENDSLKAKMTFELAYINYSKLHNAGAAKSLAHKAANLRSGYGEPYLLIADIVAGTRDCGENPCVQKSVFWLATDYANKAKAADSSPEIASDANRKIGIYKSNYPNNEDCFFHNIMEGQTISVPCFGETTTVRF